MVDSRARTGAGPVSESESQRRSNFIRDIVAEDVARGAFGGKVVTRFPPEPNGYMHFGHAYASRISFEIAREFGGRFHLRFDDTNPLTERIEYVDKMIEALRWNGIEWGDNLFFASDYFPQMYDYAVQLIRQRDAYVCEQGHETIRAQRGTLTEPGVDSPYRERPVEESLALLERMKRGDVQPGKAVVRARIDMASPNLLMRDPVMYRIVHASHYRQGDAWKIYPTYDWAHGLEDSLEGVTHSLCSIEFENHRPLYDWYLDKLGVHHPKQIEFSRLNMTHTVASKRKLALLVEKGIVSGWDDPRMPTVLALARRGIPQKALHDFLDLISVSKAPLMVDISLLEYCTRQVLNQTADRAMAVLRPLKLVIDNYPEGQVEWLEAVNNPEDPAAGSRKVPFARELYIERDDFEVSPPPKYFRLSPGREVRLKHAYLVTCERHVTDPRTGEVTEIHCRYDPETRGGASPDGRKVKGTLHWVSAAHAATATVRLYDRLFAVEHPDEGEDFLEHLNPKSLEVLEDCKLEPALAEADRSAAFQFLRHGYFVVDPDSTPARKVWNQVVSLKDTWEKLQKRSGKAA
jgi:glutaminyl-tRNA synthetase